MAQKETDITQQLDVIAEQIKLKGFMFKDNYDSDDEDDEGVEQDPNVFLKDMNCCFILYLGSMTSKESLDNHRLNCLYSQIKKQNHLITSQNKEMELVYILFIGPNADKKNRDGIREKITKLTNNSCNIFIDYFHNSLPIITSSNPVEQLFLLKDTFFNKTNIAQFKNINNNEVFYATENIETSTEFKFLYSEKEIIFLKPTIPVVESEFFTLLSKMIEYYINENEMSKVIIVNGFWFETNSSLQDVSESYLINNMEKGFIKNILLGTIPYFIPFISEMKKRYNNKFVMVNQYFHQIPDLRCLDVIPRILSANAEVTLNGDQFLLRNNVSETKSGGKRKTNRKTKKKLKKIN